MKLKTAFRLMLAALVSSLSTALSSTADPISPIQPVDLQCEHLNDPLGIDVRTPRLSWRLEDEQMTRGQQQTGYHLLVASSRDLLEKDAADLWDSGKVISSQSFLVPYAGRPLTSNQDCYWKVKVYDKDDLPTSWSQPARFSMGLLEASDWTGPWIQHPHSNNGNRHRHLWYRKNFELEETTSNAFVHVASLGYHELYVNGVRVDDRMLAPALTRLDKRVLYVTYDISKVLQAGNNTIGIAYGPGWSRYAFFKSPSALRVQLSATTASGKTSSMASDKSWRCTFAASENTGNTEFTKNGSHGGERLDGRRIMPDWNQTGFDDSAWKDAEELSVNVQLSAHMIEPSHVIETFAAKKVVKRESGYRVDLGKNFTGFLNIRFRGQSAGDKIVIKVADDAGTVQDFSQLSEYICSGEGDEFFENRFNYVGGRYITLEGLKQPPVPGDVVAHAVSTDMKRTGTFTSSNALFNQIYETDLWTFLANTTEGYTADCPHRERLGYGEVQFATAWGIGLPGFKSLAFYTMMVRNWSDVQEENGWINHTAPQINRLFGGPMWSSAGLNVAIELYQHTGDLRALELTCESSRRWLEFLNTHVEDGLLKQYIEHWGRFLGDWAAPGGRKERGGSPEAKYFNNCVYAKNLEDFIRIARLLEKPDLADLYQSRLDGLRKRIHEEFYNAETGLYMNGTHVQMAFALMTDVVPNRLRLAVSDKLVQSLQKENVYLDMGSSGLPILLKYMIEESGHGDLLYPPLNSTAKPGYGHFIKMGETTWPEYWEVNVPSRIHTCYTGISSWFVKSLAGIRADPNKPGYQSFLIAPVICGDLTFAEATAESPYGTIFSRWDRTGDHIKLTSHIPPNSRATVHLPTNNPKQVTEGGKPLSAVEGVQFLEGKDGSLMLEVPAGRYEFQFRTSKD